MIEYIIKIILCSALFWLVYFLFLEKEKMYRFNRFYLLFSIAFSLMVPFITIHIEKYAPLQMVNEFVLSPTEMSTDAFPQQEILQNSTEKSNVNTKDVLLLVYCIITVFLLIMFARHLFTMYSKTRGKKYISYKGSRLILIEENLTPHSFLNYIFLNRTAFEKEEIEEEILCHELTHVKQYHSIDVILIELIAVFCWFNPFIFFYKRAIKLNHEFLADEGVIHKFQNTRAYQYLLIEKTRQQPALPITSQFNFLITKKRLFMITKYTSPKIALMKYCLVVTVLIAAILAFSAKSILAQETKHTTQSIKQSTPNAIPKSTNSAKVQQSDFYAGGTKEGASQELLTEYQTIINRTKTPNMSWYDFRENIPSSDSKRLEDIFKEMSKEQQQRQTVIFMKPSRPLSRVVPTQQQFENYKNGKIYGVWVNDKKVNNSTLNNYSAEDFAQVFVSKLYGAARKGRNYSHQVNMMTNDYYQAYYDRKIADKSNTMVFQSTKVLKK